MIAFSHEFTQMVLNHFQGRSLEVYEDNRLNLLYEVVLLVPVYQVLPEESSGESQVNPFVNISLYSKNIAANARHRRRYMQRHHDPWMVVNTDLRSRK